MKYLKGLFSKERPIKDFISLALSVLMLIISILYISIDPGALKIEDFSRTFAFVMALLGIAIGILPFFLKIKIISNYAPLLSTVCYSIACGRQLYLAAYPLADAATGVNWFGGNLTIYLTFFIFFLLAAVTEITIIFLPEKEQ